MFVGLTQVFASARPPAKPLLEVFESFLNQREREKMRLSFFLGGHSCSNWGGSFDNVQTGCIVKVRLKKVHFPGDFLEGGELSRARL